jgi:hypothetical protein
MLLPPTLEEIRFDGFKHYVRMSTTRGICKQCKQRSKYCCTQRPVSTSFMSRRRSGRKSRPSLKGNKLSDIF